MSLDAGTDFDVVAVSFDARETPAMAAAKKDAYLGRYKRPNAAGGWHFLTGDAAAIERLTKAVGFRFRYDKDRDQFAHASAVMVATPDGRLARYFYGIEYAPRDLRLGLVEASAGTHRDARRPGPALLLPLRPGQRQVRPGDREHHPAVAASRRWRILGISLVVMSRRRAPDARGGFGSGAMTPALSRAGLDLRRQRRRALSLPDRRHGVLLAADRDARRRLRPASSGARRPTKSRQDVHESGLLEIVWTVIPFGLTMVMFFWGAKVFFQITRPPANAIEIYVTAKQWMWKLQHEDGHREMNELHVPIGQPVRLTMASEDVIHSFFVPAFRFKRDVVPGRFSTAWFEATKPGKYHLFCAEYCGTRHSNMIGWIYVMTPADYQAWLAGGTPGETLASAGAKRFVEQACNTCHGEQKGARGPSLTRPLRLAPCASQSGQTVVADEAYIRESIVNPQAKLRRGLSADHADLPGPDQRGGAPPAHRVHQVPVPGAGRRRLRTPPRRRLPRKGSPSTP